MPYLIEEAGRNHFYVVNVETGQRFSQKPLTKQQAIAQYYALESRGDGLVDSVKAILSLHKGIRLDFQPKIRNFMKQHGSDVITRMRVGRAPVISAVKKFVNFITFGSLEKMVKEKGYDDVFHLFMFIDLKAANGSTTVIQLEKNEVINLIQNPTEPRETYFLEVTSFPENMTLSQLLDGCRERMGVNNFFKYDALSNNCQVFILNLLQSLGNGEYLTAQLNQFIYQDTATLEKEASSFAKKLMRGATNIAALANTVIEGRALKVNK